MVAVLAVPPTGPVAVKITVFVVTADETVTTTVPTPLALARTVAAGIEAVADPETATAYAVLAVKPVIVAVKEVFPSEEL
jgi:hypothetical protein